MMAVSNIQKKMLLRATNLLIFIVSFFLTIKIGTVLFTLNISESLQRGIYINTFERPSKGKIILFCPPPEKIFIKRKGSYALAGRCKRTNTDPMIKRIVAEENDTVTIDGKGVAVNGEYIQGSVRYANIKHMCALPYSRTLKKDEFMVMADHPLSFDGRYFGVLGDLSDVKTLKPLFLWQ